jgi:hypothetical protein
MLDVAVLFATAAAIFGAPTVALLFTVRESDEARAAFSPTGAAENEPPVSSKSIDLKPRCDIEALRTGALVFIPI